MPVANDAVHSLTLDHQRDIQCFTFTGTPAIELPNAKVGSEATDYVSGAFYKAISNGSGGITWTAVGGFLDGTGFDFILYP